MKRMYPQTSERPSGRGGGQSWKYLEAVVKLNHGKPDSGIVLLAFTGFIKDKPNWPKPIISLS